MPELEQLSPEQRQRRISSQRKRALFGGVAGGTTLAAASMALAPKAARLVLKRPGAVPKGVASRARSVDANRGKWQERANNTWLFGALPGAGSGLMAAQATASDAREDSRRLRRDGSMRPVAKSASRFGEVAKSDEWRSHVSDSALQGHKYLTDGAKKDRRKATAAYAGGAAAAIGAAPVVGAVMDHRGVRSRYALPAVVGSTAAGVGALVAGGKYSDKKRKKAMAWDSKADRIKQAGVDRMAGLRDDGPVRKELDDVVIKALLKPTGAVIGNAVRTGGVVRTASGKLIYRRGGGQKVVRPGQGVVR